MGNPLSKIVVFLVMIVAIIFVPVYQSYEKQDSLAYHQAFQSVTTFVDNVRHKGYITPQMYNDFQQSIEVGNYLFDIELIHQEKVYSPIYTDPANANTFTGEYDVIYDEYYNPQIMKVLYPDNNKRMDDPTRIYKMHQGDTFKVQISNKATTKSALVRSFLTLGKVDEESFLEIPYGGMVLNEDL